MGGTRLSLVAACVACAACARGAAGSDGSGDPIDAARVDTPKGDARIDAPIDAPISSGPAALLLTEIVLAPSTAEFVEIANPSAETIALDHYYLTDSNTYFRISIGAPNVDTTDFVVRFPAGASIGPKATITVALDTVAAYETTYGAPPTFSVAGGTMVVVSMSGTASLTNGGEMVALFHWNGQDDLVRDVDLMLAGVPTVANSIADKSGVALDGPDANADASAYATDARTIAVQPSAPAAARSTKRIALETGHEVQTGTGNGITGDDETTENTAVTWDTAFTPPTPGELPPGLLPP